MYDLITNLLEPISYFISALAVLCYPAILNKFIRWVLFIYFLLATLLMSVASYFVFIHRGNNILYNWLLLISLVSIGLYYHHIFLSRFKKKLSIALILLQLGYYVFAHYFLPASNLFDSYGFSLLSLSTVILFFAYCHQLLNNVSTRSIYSSFDFWVNLN